MSIIMGRWYHRTPSKMAVLNLKCPYVAACRLDYIDIPTANWNKSMLLIVQQHLKPREHYTIVPHGIAENKKSFSLNIGLGI